MGWTSRTVVCFSPQGCKVRLVSTALDGIGIGIYTCLGSACGQPSRRYLVVADSQARSFHGSFLQPPVLARELTLASWQAPQSCAVGPMGRAILKVVAGSLPMFIPTLPSRCIILKSWAPDAIPDIISGEKINTAKKAWSLTDQADHEHWQDFVNHLLRA